MVTSIDILGLLVLWREWFWKCPAVVPWATVDVESGSIKTWILCVESTPLIIWLLQKCFEKTLLLMNPCMYKTLLYRKWTLALSLIYPVHDLYYPPSWVWSDLLSFYRGGSELYSWRHRVGRRPAPNLACGSGFPQQAYYRARVWCYLRCCWHFSLAFSPYVVPRDSGTSVPATLMVCTVMNHLM
jgi:hypothetical protein